MSLRFTPKVGVLLKAEVFSSPTGDEDFILLRLFFSTPFWSETWIKKVNKKIKGTVAANVFVSYLAFQPFFFTFAYNLYLSFRVSVKLGFRVKFRTFTIFICSFFFKKTSSWKSNLPKTRPAGKRPQMQCKLVETDLSSYLKPKF